MVNLTYGTRRKLEARGDRQHGVEVGTWNSSKSATTSRSCRHALAFNVVGRSSLSFWRCFFLATKGLNFSIEFTGGTVMEVS